MSSMTQLRHRRPDFAVTHKIASFSSRPTAWQLAGAVVEPGYVLCVSAMERLGLQGREEKMGRKFIDCREFPCEMNCTLALADEVIE